MNWTTDVSGKLAALLRQMRQGWDAAHPTSSAVMTWEEMADWLLAHGVVLTEPDRIPVPETRTPKVGVPRSPSPAAIRTLRFIADTGTDCPVALAPEVFYRRQLEGCIANAQAALELFLLGGDL